FNTTRAGIHADGLHRDERIYNIFDTEKLLNRACGVAITDKAGADGVMLWVNKFLGLEGKGRLSKIKLVKLCRYVADEYSGGRTTAISEEEMIVQLKLHLPQIYEQHVKPMLEGHS
ncbi:2-isopropylmalate synthase, partial [bacterium]|nr:2-isopropylmalate synthase [bacterium]